MANGFVHTELSVDDVKAAQKFYGAIFDWKFQDLGPSMGNYVMLDYGSSDTGGGITPKMMPTQPTGWLPYVEVKSVKATMAKAQQAGATVVVPFQEVGSMGAIGIFVDPQGASLGVWERSAAATQRTATTKKEAPATKKKKTAAPPKKTAKTTAKTAAKKKKK